MTFLINKYECDDDNGDNKNTRMGIFSMCSHKMSLQSDKGVWGLYRVT